MTQVHSDILDGLVLSVNAAGSSRIVLVCEHASNFIPASFDGLGLSQDALDSHAVWDPGALAVATQLSSDLDAPLVASGVSRLVYDCNRPPEAIDAMPERSEVIEVPGNRGLTDAARAARTNDYYKPFHAALRDVLRGLRDPIVVTVHSFTPVYHGQMRRVEIGVLHDSDTRLADAMLACAKVHTNAEVQRNEPYGPTDGVTHTLTEHAVKHGYPNVMLEVRNDLIETAAQQMQMAQILGPWISDAVDQLSLQGGV